MTVFFVLSPQKVATVSLPEPIKRHFFASQNLVGLRDTALVAYRTRCFGGPVLDEGLKVGGISLGSEAFILIVKLGFVSFLLTVWC